MSRLQLSRLGGPARTRQAAGSSGITSPCSAAGWPASRPSAPIRLGCAPAARQAAISRSGKPSLVMAPLKSFSATGRPAQERGMDMARGPLPQQRAGGQGGPGHRRGGGRPRRVPRRDCRPWRARPAPAVADPGRQRLEAIGGDAEQFEGPGRGQPLRQALQPVAGEHELLQRGPLAERGRQAGQGIVGQGQPAQRRRQGFGRDLRQGAAAAADLARAPGNPPAPAAAGRRDCRSRRRPAAYGSAARPGGSATSALPPRSSNSRVSARPRISAREFGQAEAAEAQRPDAGEVAAAQRRQGIRGLPVGATVTRPTAAPPARRRRCRASGPAARRLPPGRR